MMHCGHLCHFDVMLSRNAVRWGDHVSVYGMLSQGSSSYQHLRLLIGQSGTIFSIEGHVVRQVAPVGHELHVCGDTTRHSHTRYTL